MLPSLQSINSLFGDNLFDDFFEDLAKPARSLARFASPSSDVMRTDVKETEDSFELDIDLPGYKKEDVKAELKDGYMKVSAETKQVSNTGEEDGSKYLRRERYFGSCSRTFYVGDDIKQEDIKARFEDGILKISIPKKEKPVEPDNRTYINID